MKQLENAFSQLNISYNEKTIEKFQKYMEIILKWNEKVNLTAITEKDEFIKKHFIDSLICADYPEYKNAQKLIDVGTGAGFPGIPLALISPEKEFLLVDSLNKRIKILNEICESLEIRNVKNIHSRAEELARKKEHREKYDVCVSRAVANLPTLCEYCLPFVRVGGMFLAYKGPDCHKEMETSKRVVEILGGKIKDVRNIQLAGFYLEHKIICIEKIKETTSKYPRKAGTPSKEPLV